METLAPRLWLVSSCSGHCLLQTEVVHLEEAQLVHDFSRGSRLQVLSKKDHQAHGQLGFLLGA